MTKKEMNRSQKLAAQLIFIAFQGLMKNDGQLSSKEVTKYVETHAQLDDWAKHTYEKSGYVRWESMLHFFSIDCSKAGYLVKKNGVWFLTQEGKEATTLGAEELLLSAVSKYKSWKKENKAQEEFEETDKEPEIETARQTELNLEEAQNLANEGLKKYIDSKNPYELQDLVAALLRGMGYYTPFVAPKGKDGGVDIIAYKDPLGTETPRLMVQVKHRIDSAKVTEVRELMGLIHRSGDVGVFVSTGGFTPDCKQTARTSINHVELIDLERFISLWRQFYNKIPDEDKLHMPLKTISFLAPDE